MLAGPPPSATDRLYTGQRQEPPTSDVLGLYDYHARFYSTLLGRFVSVDPVISDAYDPQAWNGYSYVENNPLGRTDPTGERLCDVDDCNGSDQGSGPGNGDQTPYNGGAAPCTGECVTLQQLAALGIHSQADLAAFQYNQALAYCAEAPTACGGGGRGSNPAIPVAVAGAATVGGLAGFGEGAGVCEAVTGGGCTPIVVVGAGAVGCYYLCEDAAGAIASGAKGAWNWLAGSKPESSSPDGSARQGAFNEAKRDAGIPTSRQAG